MPGLGRRPVVPGIYYSVRWSASFFLLAKWSLVWKSLRNTGLERLVNSQVGKWLVGTEVPLQLGALSELSLPISSLVEAYKCAKARLEMTLTESRDSIVRGVAPTLATGKKWTPASAVLDTKSALRHRDIVGYRVSCGLWSQTGWASSETVDVLPSPTNLSLRLGELVSLSPECSSWLKLIFIVCKTSLIQGRCT